MKEIKVKKYREIVRRMMGRISENGKDWAKPRSTAIQAYKSPPYDQLQSSGRRNLDGGADQQLSLFPSEKEQIQKIDEAENAEASSAFSVSGELYYQVQQFREIKRSSYRTLVE